MKKIYKILVLASIILAYWFFVNVFAEMDFSNPPELNLTELDDCYWTDNVNNYSMSTYNNNGSIFCEIKEEDSGWTQGTSIGHSLEITVEKKRKYGRIYGSDTSQDLYLFNTSFTLPWKRNSFNYAKIHLGALFILSSITIFMFRSSFRRKYAELPELPNI